MKSIYKCLVGSFSLIAAFLLVIGCSEKYEYTTDYSFYKDVKLKVKLVDENNVLSIRLANATHALTIAVTPEDAFIDSKAYTYEVADETIATIGQDGMLTLLKAGETTITVKFRGDQQITTSCTLKVEPTKVNSLTIVNAGDGIRVEEGKELDLAKYTVVAPSDADNKELLYKVKEGDEEHAEMVGSVAKGLKKGTAIILVSTTDGTNITEELTLEVTGKIPMSTISLNCIEQIKDKTLAIGQVFDFGSAVTVAPENASDKALKYELVSGAGAASITEDGVVKTLAAGEVEIKISPVDPILNNISGHTVKFTVSTTQVWFERAFWFVDTTVRYSGGSHNGLNYIDDKGNGKPEYLVDDKSNTYLAMVKPEKGAYEGSSHPKGAEYGFIIDLGAEHEFNCLKWRHRAKSTNNQAFKIKVSGSNDNESFTIITENVEVKSTLAEELDKEIPLSKCRYIKVEYTEYDIKNGLTLCVAEFNVGKK